MPSKNGWRHHFIPRHDMSGQSGNVFIIIMLGVFLFGALMYMFSRSAQQGTGNLTKQQAKIAAQEILNYARLVEGAVDRVRRNGCSEIEISFENDVVAGYENPNSPADKSCHIFDDAGGKVSYFTPPESWNDTSQSSQSLYNELYFPSRLCVFGVGEGRGNCQNDGIDNEDMVLFIPYLKNEICAEINKSLFDTSNIIADVGSIWGGEPKFTGAFSDGNSLIDSPINQLSEVVTYCIEGGGTQPSSGTYHFYHVLLAR